MKTLHTHTVIDHYGDEIEVSIEAHTPGHVFLEVHDSQAGVDGIAELTPARARDLAAALVEAAEKAEANA